MGDSGVASGQVISHPSIYNVKMDQNIEDSPGLSTPGPQKVMAIIHPSIPPPASAALAISHPNAPKHSWNVTPSTLTLPPQAATFAGREGKLRNSEKKCMYTHSTISDSEIKVCTGVSYYKCLIPKSLRARHWIRKHAYIYIYVRTYMSLANEEHMFLIYGAGRRNHNVAWHDESLPWSR